VSQTRPAFPSTATDLQWPGAWKYGVDFSAGSHRVVAVQVNTGDGKYDTNWLGPIELTEENAGHLESWAETSLYYSGGYVHLFPADGDATAELDDYVSEHADNLDD